MHEKRYAIVALLLSLPMLFFDIWESMMQGLGGLFRTTDTFLDTEVRAALMMNEYSIPSYLIASTLLSAMICSLTMIYALYKIKRGFYTYLQFSRVCLMLFVTALALQIWSFSGAFSESKQEEVRSSMQKEIKGVTGLSETIRWKYTQNS
ncbi:unnamed protein product, partial [Allacma fusca]